MGAVNFGVTYSSRSVPSIAAARHAAPMPAPSAADSARLARLRRAICSDDLELPSLPEVALQVAQLDASADAGTLSALIRRDVGLASQVLRVANSALYSRAAPAASLQQAIARLGTEQVRSLALAAAARSSVFAADIAEGALAALWHEAVACACFAQEIARLKRRSVEAAYVSGLLHRAGRALLFWRLAQAATAEPIDAAMLARLEPDIEARECIAGAKLARAWNLPPVVMACMSHWRRMQGAAEADRKAVAEVILARSLTRSLDLADDEPVDPDALQLPRAERELLSLYDDDVTRLLQRRAAIRETLASHA